MLVYMQMIEVPKDRDKFAYLYSTYKGLMFHVANQILRNEQDAEDAVQEAFFAVAKNISKISFENLNKTRGLMVVIVERKALNILKANSRQRAQAYDEEYCGSYMEKPEGELGAAMLRLKPQHREVLYLKFYCGYSGAETAQILDMSEGMARYTIMQAKQALREELAKEGIEV